jgi:penicillin-binding protein 1A
MVRVDAASGRLAWANDADAIWEAFKPGTEPTSDEADNVVEGGPGIESTAEGASDTMPATPDYGVGIVVPPTAGRPGQPPQTVPASGGLY